MTKIDEETIDDDVKLHLSIVPIIIKQRDVDGFILKVKQLVLKMILRTMII